MLLKETVVSGQFPAIWATQINQGFGYPLFHLYAPLFHYLALLFSFIFTLEIALKITLGLTILIGVSGTWLFTRQWGKASAALATISFILSPFIALDLYVRGAFAELLALCLLPWVLYALSNLKNMKSILFASLVTSLFLSAHNLIPILALPLLLIYTLIQKPPFKLFLLYGILTLGLSAWFIGPLLFERSFTQAESIAKTTDYLKHFVEPWQIWNSTWGFGGSGIGVEDGMSFKLGKLQLILAGLGFLCALLAKKSVPIVLGIFAFLYLFLATPSSKSLWQSHSTLQLVQFPWRSLGPALVLLSMLAGYSLSLIKPKIFRYSMVVLLGFFLLALNLKYFRPQSEITFPTKVEDIAPVVPEYLPVWMPTKPIEPSKSGEVAYYPTWIVKQNEIKLKTYPDSAGILRYERVGDSPVVITQGHTQLQKLSYLITVITILIMLFLARKKEI